jgi:AhpD family alkylhydroperoxidase
MPRLPLRTISDAPDETKGALTAAEKTNGFLLNLLRILANAPVALETYLTVSAINARSSLTLAEREAVQITAAAVYGCGFCVAGHTAIAAKKVQMEPSVIAALRSRTTVDAPRINAVAQCTEAVISSRGAVSDDALATFKQAVFNEPAALEVVLGVSLATLCNFANNLGQPPLNEQLARYQWTPTSPSVAE